MDEKLKQQWVAALRSGKYKKCTQTLKNVSGEFCAMGVLADIDGCTWTRGYAGYNALSPHNGILYGYGYGRQYDVDTGRIAHLNDSLGWSFEHIADYIEKKL